LIIGAVSDPTKWHRWNEVETLLEPARQQADEPIAIIEPDEVLWVVLDGDELLACATAWLSNQGYAEVVLVGGRDHSRWIRQLDETIGRAAAEAGALRLTAWGRRGWAKILRELGWDSFPVDNKTNGYVRRLVPEGV